MQLFAYVKNRSWPTLFGYAFFIGMMATGYYYNLTYVQLGLFDLGTRVIGLSEAEVARDVGIFALITCAAALAFGTLMQRSGWSANFHVKLRLAFFVALTQSVLTAIGPFLRSEPLLLGWIILASLALGLGVPVTFGLTVDLIPARDRGYVAATITALAYFVAAVFSSVWIIERFAIQVMGPMLAGTVVVGVLAFGRFDFIERLASQHRLPEFHTGRLLAREAPSTRYIGRRILIAALLMFGIFFIDSLGFLRLIFTPVYVNSAWHSGQAGTLLFIGVTHVVAAFIGGILYSALDVRTMFQWVFGLFALVQLMYTFHARLTPGSTAVLAMPMLYATAVSMYTVLNFAMWADISTPRTISRNVAIGVATSGWTATFLSTALAIRWRLDGLPLAEHLNRVAALAMLFFLLAFVIWTAQNWAERVKA